MWTIILVDTEKSKWSINQFINQFFLRNQILLDPIYTGKMVLAL
jgi:1-aminocyclopropane-1-carboxylate deaminase/D-cysteine desulfhydrase-like pyridoxal-dependent ACC family enzyme